MNVIRATDVRTMRRILRQHLTNLAQIKTRTRRVYLI